MAGENGLAMKKCLKGIKKSKKICLHLA